MEMGVADNKQVVVGLGLTGLSCVRYLTETQQDVAVVDSREKPPGLEDFNRLYADVPIKLGPISYKDLSHANCLVVSPGVALTEPAIAQAIENGVLVCGDIDLFRSVAKAPIVAITGSNGKSTVTTLIGEMIERAGKKVAVGGNIGIPALDLLAQDVPDFYVLELSSFQLERAGSLNVEVATVLNISADHMDRYEGMGSYVKAKQKIFEGCKKIVVNRADLLARPPSVAGKTMYSFGLDAPAGNEFGIAEDKGAEFLAFQSEKLLPVNDLKIAGKHNLENALAALALGKAIGLDMESMIAALRDFAGLEHRCQYVAERKGVKFYNDSKGTNVGASIASINGLAGSGRHVVLIAGGDAKDADFTPMQAALRKHVKAVVLIGEAADLLETVCGEHVPFEHAISMEQAVAKAALIAESGDVVLLSPACASFDMFQNYQHRGDVFQSSVLSLLQEGAH